ncbi:cupin domain-containing protein [Streptomyces sp. NPDC048282]|uniref:cupin domain-containing protein n=1 Tax=unclassified Streptomyces TaxID=2593676 RepID=UPI003723C60A
MRGESGSDEHPHDEFDYVLEGRSFVECDGSTAPAHAGDLVLVPAGAVGTYRASDYARMPAVHGPKDVAP